MCVGESPVSSFMILLCVCPQCDTLVKLREGIRVPIINMFKGEDLSVLPKAKDIRIHVWALSDMFPILDYSSHELGHDRE